MKSKPFFLLAALAIFTLLTSCSDDDSILTAIRVANDDIVLTAIGQTEQIDAEPIDQDGQVMDEPMTWKSLDTDVVTVSSAGMVTAVGAGETRITITSGFVREHVDVTVEL